MQDYTLVQKAAVKPKTNTGNVNIKAKQSSFKTVRCKKVLVARVKMSGGKGGNSVTVVAAVIYQTAVRGVLIASTHIVLNIYVELT